MKIKRISHLISSIALVFLCNYATAQPVELNESLNETVQRIPKKGIFTIELETTIYKPDGEGPFPIALINHGRALGDSRFQPRYRPGGAARYFLQRGYAVVVPMRQGFSKSGGSYIGGGCNVESNGRVQAEDVKAVLDFISQQSWADKNRIVVLGQSHGGWTTLAFGALNYPGVKALVNFAGGLRQVDCIAWESNLVKGAGEYAKETRLPSLWFYGDNDSYFSPTTYRGMFEKYTALGGQAKLIAFGNFGSDAHSLFGSRDGAAIWQPEVTKFLASVDMPSEPLAGSAKYGALTRLPTPAATNFAALDDLTKLPGVKETARAGYTEYLTKAVPRAFAIAPNGAWGWADAGDDPLARALNNCNKNGKGECRLYSVDGAVVWVKE